MSPQPQIMTILKNIVHSLRGDKEGRILNESVRMQSADAAYMMLVTAMSRILIFLLAFTMASVFAQQPQDRTEKQSEDVRLPSGKMQKDEILKADYGKTLEDAAALLKAVEDLKIDLEKTDRYVLSLGTLKQLDNIEKLTKRIRSRIKHY